MSEFRIQSYSLQCPALFGGEPIAIDMPAGSRLLGLAGPAIVFAVPKESDGPRVEYTFVAHRNESVVNLPDDFSRERGQLTYLSSLSEETDWATVFFHVFYSVTYPCMEVRYMGGSAVREEGA